MTHRSLVCELPLPYNKWNDRYRSGWQIIKRVEDTISIPMCLGFSPVQNAPKGKLPCWFAFPFTFGMKPLIRRSTWAVPIKACLMQLTVIPYDVHMELSLYHDLRAVTVVSKEFVPIPQSQGLQDIVLNWKAQVNSPIKIRHVWHVVHADDAESCFTCFQARTRCFIWAKYAVISDLEYVKDVVRSGILQGLVKVSSACVMRH